MTASRVAVPILDLRPGYLALKPEIDAAIQRVVDANDFILGGDVRQFEERAAAYLGVRHAIGVNSGTDALVIGLKALGIAPGDEVITSPFSFFATAESIEHAGARPVFVDIDPVTFDIDTSLIEEAITSRTRAILPVHLFGRPAEMVEIARIAQRHGLFVVEDCAQSFGAILGDGRKTGSVGDANAFSFFPSKTLGAFGDGGLVVTNSDAVAETARALRAHGSLKKYYNDRIGYNSRLDTLQAAVLNVKLPHVDGWNAARRSLARAYNARLRPEAGIRVPEIVDGHAFHQYTVRIENGHRDGVRTYLAERGIATMVYYPVPIDRLPLYDGKYRPCPQSARASAEVLSLPIWPEMEASTQNLVIDELVSALRAAGGKT